MKALDNYLKAKYSPIEDQSAVTCEISRDNTVRLAQKGGGTSASIIWLSEEQAKDLYHKLDKLFNK
ncbi:hypothetical protein Lindwurm_ID146 [Escherichia phage Lindwurm]|uniref:Uncharacterized protein n=1 Tax=Escherichia phage Lindwurm TaxID=2872674 RepID=A0AC61TNA8_9CAUD|nr:hypothetical protein Lindwurm_ID146 [Escherichia phage Lindwurm]